MSEPTVLSGPRRTFFSWTDRLPSHSENCDDRAPENVLRRLRYLMVTSVGAVNTLGVWLGEAE